MGESSARLAVVIEDDADVRHLLRTILVRSGFEVILTKDGAEGVEAVRTHDPDLTTLDVNMPGMDGFAAAKLIREFSSTYIIMLTGLDDEIDVVQGLDSGADDYLVKPFRPRELRARIESVMRRPRRMAEGDEVPARAAEEPAAVHRPAHVETPPAQPLQQQPVHHPAPQQPVADPWHEPAAYASPHQAVQQPAAVHQQTYPAQPAPAPSEVPAAQDQARATNGWHPGRGGVAHAASVSAAAAPVQPQTHDAWLRCNGLAVNVDTRTVVVDGRTVELTRTEFDLVASLLSTGRRVRSKADLVLTLRGQNYVTTYFVNEADKRAVEVHMANVRRKLGDSSTTPRWIETVRGVGYRMAEDA
jgi:DNA-binding response OmpR family regulator